ncbi:MAG: replicative helicase, partial [Actinomycetota bacterium]
TKIVQLGYSAEGEIDDVVDLAEQEVYQVTERRAGEDFVQLNTLIPAALDQIEKMQSGELAEGVKTGFKDLDSLTNGLHPGNMIVVAARPAVGKSTLGLDIARSAAIHNGDCSVIFSLEMSRSEITMRMLSAEARVSLNNIRSGTLSDDEWARLARRMGEINDAPLFIDDSPNLSMMEIRAKARRLKQRHDLKLVVIDYLQLMSSGKKVENRQQEVSEFSRQLKLLAKELNVPVIAISQLNRSPEQRSDKKPMLSDLRESGSIEQDADVVILLHRDDLYDPQNRSGEADLIVAKHRNGPTKTVTVASLLHFAKFADMAPKYVAQENIVKDN